MYNLAIIGGGAAGIMAAISFKRKNPENSVILIDRTFALGRKILVCGAGRCNVTNLNLNKDFATRYHGAEKTFVSDVISRFGYPEILAFFAELGVELYVERKTDIGKLFPTTNQASTITSLLCDELERLKVEILLETECTKISKNQNFSLDLLGVKTSTRKTINAHNVLLSAGGMSYPSLGSNGSGYTLAQSLGHSIYEPVPSALPLESTNPLSHPLQGQKLDVAVTSIIDGKVVKTRENELMITKYGFSGPAILDISREISIAINREHNTNCEVLINFMPGQTSTSARLLLEERWKKRPDQTIEKSLFGLFPNKFASSICDIAQISRTKLTATLSEPEKVRLVSLLTNFVAPISKTRGWNEAEFTAGGIKTTEVNSKTLESKIIKGLFFCGEILDVDGDVGGFNLSWAWASGWVVGQTIAN